MNNKNMTQDILLTLKSDLVQDLELYSKELNIDINTIAAEAFEQYLEALNKKALEDSIKRHNEQTKMSFEEFWEDVDL